MLKRLSVVERIRLIEHARLITLSRILSASISLSSPFVFLFPPSLLLSFFLFNRIRSLDSTLDGLRLNDMISPLYSVPCSSRTFIFLHCFCFQFCFRIYIISPRLYFWNFYRTTLLRYLHFRLQMFQRI